MTKRVLFISMQGGVMNELYKEVRTPLPETYRFDVPVPAEVMDPKNTKPGSVWTVETEFTLQKNEAGEESYISTRLLEKYKNSKK